MKRKLIALCISSLLVGTFIVFNMNQDVSVPTVEKFTEDTSLSVSKHEAIVSEHENVDKNEKTGAGDTMKKPESKEEKQKEKLMKSFVISKRDAGTRVDRFIDKTFENLPKSLMYKEIRKKNIKVNKKRCTNDQKLKEGDLLELYLKDDVLKLKVKHLDFMRASDELDIVYEDENIIILNKNMRNILLVC